MTSAKASDDLAVEHITVTPEALEAYRDAQNRLAEAERWQINVWTWEREPYYRASSSQVVLDARASEKRAAGDAVQAARGAVHAAYLVAFEGAALEDAEVMVALGYKPSERALSAASGIASMYFAELRAGGPRLPLRVARPRA